MVLNNFHELGFKDDRIYFKIPYDLRHLAKEVPNNRWEPAIKAWTWPPKMYDEIKRQLGWLNQDDSAWADLWAVCQIEIRANEMLQRQCLEILRDEHPELDYVKEKYPFLMLHQAQAVALVLVRKRICLFYDTGVGKTLAGLAFFSALVDRNPKATMLVVCPRPIINPSWFKDASDYMAKELHGRLVNLREHPKGTRQVPPGKCGIINFESYLRDRELQLAAHTAIWVDESVRIKTEKAQIRKALDRAEAGFRIAATGLPDPNTEEDFWGQIHFVQGKKESVVDDSFWLWRERWFTPGKVLKVRRYDPRLRKEVLKTVRRDYKLDEGEERGFYASIAPICVFKRLEECVELPPEIEIPMYVDMPPALRRIYDAAEQGFAIDLKSGFLSPSQKKNRIMELRKLAAGYYESENGEILFSNYKVDLMLEVLQTLGEARAVVWTSFHEEFDNIRRLFLAAEIDLTAADGRSSNKCQQQVIERFMGKKARVLMTNSACMKHGLNFQHHCHVCFYPSFSYNYDDWYQTHHRIRRKGQDKNQLYYYFMANNSIDGIMLRALQGKKHIADQAAEEIMKRWQKRKPVTSS